MRKLNILVSVLRFHSKEWIFLAALSAAWSGVNGAVPLGAICRLMTVHWLHLAEQEERMFPLFVHLEREQKIHREVTTAMRTLVNPNIFTFYNEMYIPVDEMCQ